MSLFIFFFRACFPSRTRSNIAFRSTCRSPLDDSEVWLPILRSESSLGTEDKEPPSFFCIFTTLRPYNCPASFDGVLLFFRKFSSLSFSSSTGPSCAVYWGSPPFAFFTLLSKSFHLTKCTLESNEPPLSPNWLSGIRQCHGSLNT